MRAALTYRVLGVDAQGRQLEDFSVTGPVSMLTDLEGQSEASPTTKIRFSADALANAAKFQNAIAMIKVHNKSVQKYWEAMREYKAGKGGLPDRPATLRGKAPTYETWFEDVPGNRLLRREWLPRPPHESRWKLNEDGTLATVEDSKIWPVLKQLREEIDPDSGVDPNDVKSAWITEQELRKAENDAYKRNQEALKAINQAQRRFDNADAALKALGVSEDEAAGTAEFKEREAADVAKRRLVRDYEAQHGEAGAELDQAESEPRARGRAWRRRERR